jgi:ribosomal protein S12 methylthiotransferase accessory factor
VNRQEQFFGLNTLGANMEGSKMHTQLLIAYGKVQRPQQKP